MSITAACKSCRRFFAPLNSITAAPTDFIGNARSHAAKLPRAALMRAKP
jgi:hypothetical protein